jgi:hypothetical protein
VAASSLDAQPMAGAISGTIARLAGSILPNAAGGGRSSTSTRR